MLSVRVPLALMVLVSLAACRGEMEDGGTITGKAIPAADVATRATDQHNALVHLAPDAPPAKQILFGDMHVHTTFSVDAFMRTLPY